MGGTFFEQFLYLSTWQTVLFLILLFVAFFIIYQLQKRKVNFNQRVFTGIFIGIVLGLGIQAMSGFSSQPMEQTFVKETLTWYALFGNGYIDLIRMLVIPLVLVFLTHVILETDEKAGFARLGKITLIVTLSMAMLAASVGFIIGMLFQLGQNSMQGMQEIAMKEVVSIPETLRSLIPANPAQAMVDVNVIGLVILAVLFGLGAKRMRKKYPEVILPFEQLISALHKIIMSVAMTIMKFMPYAVIALMSTTIAGRGLASIKDVGMFIIALYTSVIVMSIFHGVILLFYGKSMFQYFKQSAQVLLLAFTSRSSVSVLPFTIETLVERLEVEETVASFATSFGTTAGMQGCAGIFPALLIVYVSGSNHIPINSSLFFMSVIVITIASLGIAGIPGTATMAASVNLSGVGYGAYFPMISGILAIDPIIDMGRTFLNVSGSMVNAIIIDHYMKKKKS